MMKNLGLSLTVLTLLVVSMISITSAEITKTVVAGTIYNADYSDVVADAFVQVTCNGNNQTANSSSDGHYAVDFNIEQCDVGDLLLVYAEKDGLSGTNNDENVHDGDDFGIDVNIGIANVALIPEFGLVVGALTILSALGVFFVIRRK